MYVNTLIRKHIEKKNKDLPAQCSHEGCTKFYGPIGIGHWKDKVMIRWQTSRYESGEASVEVKTLWPRGNQ